MASVWAFSGMGADVKNKPVFGGKCHGAKGATEGSLPRVDSLVLREKRPDPKGFGTEQALVSPGTWVCP